VGTTNIPYESAVTLIMPVSGSYETLVPIYKKNMASHSRRQSSSKKYNFKCKEDKESENAVNGNLWQINKTTQ
jgi:hypothetical protein